MCKKDVFALIPTGGGKSLTFHLPAFLEKWKLTFVIMPLLSLIEDNMREVREKVMSVVKFTSEKSDENETETIKRILNETGENRVKLVYTTPKTMIRLLEILVKPLYERRRIARFVIDEAHCIKIWGENLFVKKYLELK